MFTLIGLTLKINEVYIYSNEEFIYEDNNYIYLSIYYNLPQGNDNCSANELNTCQFVCLFFCCSEKIFIDIHKYTIFIPDNNREEDRIIDI